MGNWIYEQKTLDNGVRRIARLDSVLPIAVGGAKNMKHAQLVFMDDPVSGYDCALHLGAGDFRVSTAIASRVGWKVDDRELVDILASRPAGEAPRLSLRDPRHRWFELRNARLLTVSFRGNDYKRHKAMFDVSGLDRSQLDWDQQRYAEQYWERRERALLSDGK